MGPIDRPETSVGNYHYPLRNNPEERSSHLLRGGSVKSRIDPAFLTFALMDRHLLGGWGGSWGSPIAQKRESGI